MRMSHYIGITEPIAEIFLGDDQQKIFYPYHR